MTMRTFFLQVVAILAVIVMGHFVGRFDLPTFVVPLLTAIFGFVVGLIADRLNPRAAYDGYEPRFLLAFFFLFPFLLWMTFFSKANTDPIELAVLGFITGVFCGLSWLVAGSDREVRN